MAISKNCTTHPFFENRCPEPQALGKGLDEIPPIFGVRDRLLGSVQGRQSSFPIFGICWFVGTIKQEVELRLLEIVKFLDETSSRATVESGSIDFSDNNRGEWGIGRFVNSNMAEFRLSPASVLEPHCTSNIDVEFAHSIAMSRGVVRHFEKYPDNLECLALYLSRWDRGRGAGSRGHSGLE